jgi:hypothetical protein
MNLPQRKPTIELQNMLFPRPYAVVFFLAITSATMIASCAFGESAEPGCHSDLECGVDRVCRGGACFRIIGDIDAAPPDDDAG